jgi:hypothetical protein
MKKILLALCLCLCSQVALAAATFVATGKSEHFGGATMSITVTINSGNSVACYYSWDSASTSTPTVSTDGGTGTDAFTLVYGISSSGAWKYGVWLLQSAGAGRTGATITWPSSSPSFTDGYCDSFSGLASPAIDGNSFNTANSTNPTSGNTATLTTTDQFAIGYATAASVGVGVPTAPWADDGQQSSTGSRGAHQVLTANTAIAATFTASSSLYIAYVVTFKAGGAPPPTGQTFRSLTGVGN